MHHSCAGQPRSGTRSAQLGQTAYGANDARATTVHWLGRVFVSSRQWCGWITARSRTTTTVSSGPALSTGYHAPRRSGHFTSTTKRAHRSTGGDPRPSLGKLHVLHSPYYGLVPLLGKQGHTPAVCR